MKGLDKDVRRIAIVVIVGAIMSILDTTIVNVALDTLRADLGAPLSTIQWVTTGYLLALASVIPLTGWAAERFGPRRVWLTVVTGFAASSALCGMAWSAESLIAFRVLQGLAGGMLMPIGMITLAQAAGPHRMGRVMGVVGVPMLLAPVLGPVLGGLIVTHASWRWIFFVNVPIAAVGLVLAARLLPRARAAGTGTSALDVPGLLMVSPGAALLVFGLSEVSSHGGFTTAAATALALGAILVGSFVRHALRVREPLVDVRLFASRGFAAAAATTFLVGAALFGALLLLPLYYQVARGESAFTAGLLLAPQGVGAAIAMNVSGRLSDRIGSGPVVVAGIAILTLGTLPFTQVGADTSEVLLAAALVVRGLGLGATMMPAMAAAYATLRTEQVPRATPMLNVLQRLGGSLGTAILAVILQRRAAGAGSGLDGGAAPDAARGALAHAFAATYWWALALTALALVPASLLWRSEQVARRSAAARAREREALGRERSPAAA